MLERIDHMERGKSAGLVGEYLEKLSGECLKKALLLLKDKKLMMTIFGSEKAYIKVIKTACYVVFPQELCLF